MANPVELGLALSNSFPTGTGSFGYKGQFEIVVENLAFEKSVSIRAKKPGGWADIAAGYRESLPNNRELWVAPADNSEGEFVAKYDVGGVTYWDNNGWLNYRFPQAFDEFVALSGARYPVVLGIARISGGDLHVDMGVQNLAFQKIVGLVYSVDNWTTAQSAMAHYGSTMKSGLEVWEAVVPVGSATQVDFALFYHVLGADHWDNNFWRNYRVTPTAGAQWGVPLP